LRISQRSIEEVREAANIVEVASEFTALRRQGARFTGLCPYPDHQEKTPSFSVDPERGLYHCFGCKRGGDAIKLVIELRSFSFVDAISYLADRSNVQLDFEGSDADSEAAKERNHRRRQIHKALAAATAYYHKYLLKSPSSGAEQARTYLTRRGIEISSIEEFRLGYAPPRGSSSFLGAAKKLGLDRKILADAGLLSARGEERFFGRITFPISDRRGRIVGFGARALGDAQPKYLNSPETEIFNKRDLLYGFPQVAEAIRRERAALIVEGYTDVLMLYQSGIRNVVATLGTATTPGHLRTLSSYADKSYLLFDPDVAGEKAIERAAATAAELKLDLRVMRLSEDPADWLLEHPPEDFAPLLSNTVPVLEYILRRKAGRARGAEAAERSRIMSEIEQLIDQIEDPVFREDALRIASQALGVSPEVLRGSRGKPLVKPAGPAQQRAEIDPLERAGRELLALTLAYPNLVAEYLENGLRIDSLPEPIFLSAEDFGNGSQARVFSLVQEHVGKGINDMLADERARPNLDLMSALASEGTRTVFVTDRKRRGEKVEPSKADAAQAWIGLKLASYERAKQSIEDLDEREEIWNQIQMLREALRTVSAEP
jgi:DNA primase